MATTCDFLLSCSWLRYLTSPAFQLVRNCFKMFVLFGWNPFYAGKTVPFVIYSLGRDTNFDKFCSLLINYIFSQHVLPVYCSCSVLFAWTTGGCLLSRMNTRNLQKPPVRTVFIGSSSLQIWSILYLAAWPIMPRWPIWAAWVFLHRPTVLSTEKPLFQKKSKITKWHIRCPENPWKMHSFLWGKEYTN